MSIKNNLDKILTRKIDLETLLSSGNLSSDEVVRFSTELSEIGPVAEQANLVSKLESNLEETLELLDDKGNDKEIIDLTADQYYSTGRTPPYDKGKKAGQLGWGYRKKVQKLLTKVLDKL